MKHLFLEFHFYHGDTFYHHKYLASKEAWFQVLISNLTQKTEKLKTIHSFEDWCEFLRLLRDLYTSYDGLVPQKFTDFMNGLSHLEEAGVETHVLGYDAEGIADLLIKTPGGSIFELSFERVQRDEDDDPIFYIFDCEHYEKNYF